MSNLDRRGFLRHSAAAAVSLGAGLSAVPSFQAGQVGSTSATSTATMPTGKIGKLIVSRLISGGNLISGWAHSRDLRYIPELQRRYNTEEKVLETLALCEQNGINAIIADPAAKPMEIFAKHWKQGGKIQWIAEGHPSPTDLISNVQASIDHGASAVYVQGVIGDRWYKDGTFDKLAKLLDHVRSKGLPAGMGAHKLDVVIASETSGFKPDFYVKTLHHTNYWSARRPEQNLDVVENPYDNYWCMDPEQTIEFMKTVKTPWIAFKTLAAGAIPPPSAFDYVFANGADFACVGMFDFQVAEDAQVAREVIAKHQQRNRPWYG
ncbi:MAG: twin-arginine translocation signal domain-containing protein [Phycisphaerae bacterium]|nr:twin-arginine translocation signal domain-containing protein [Phycisphaerae bacterium]